MKRDDLEKILVLAINKLRQEEEESSTGGSSTKLSRLRVAYSVLKKRAPAPMEEVSAISHSVAFWSEEENQDLFLLILKRVIAGELSYVVEVGTASQLFNKRVLAEMGFAVGTPREAVGVII